MSVTRIPARGPIGPTGPRGFQGFDGMPGLQGAVGPQGPEGPKGVMGSRGEMGPTGPRGYSGLDGDTGPQGIQGVTGPLGETGPQGLQGPTGHKPNVSIQIDTSLTKVPIIKFVVDDDFVVINGTPQNPTAITASSFVQPWVPSNTLTADSQWWVSESDTGNPEWLTYDFGPNKIYLTSVYLLSGNGRGGTNIRLQGSNDENIWTELDPLSNTWRFINATSLMEYTGQITGITDTYRYIRLYSDPTSYCLYDYVQYYGII